MLSYKSKGIDDLARGIILRKQNSVFR